LVVIEIKKGTADKSTLGQIKRYMRSITAREATDRVSGVILCRKADLELHKAVDIERNIVIDEYKLSMSFRQTEKLLG